MIKHISLLPSGIKCEPFFKTEEDYQRFRQDFIESIAPELEKQRIARMESERESMFRIVD
jgi:hypothetical protein